MKTSFCLSSICALISIASAYHYLPLRLYPSANDPTIDDLPIAYLFYLCGSKRLPPGGTSSLCNFFIMSEQDGLQLESLPESKTLSKKSQILPPGSETSNKLKFARFHHVLHNNSTMEMKSISQVMPLNWPSPKVTEPSSSEFQFVNISEPADMKDSKNKKLVRRSVAFSHRRKQVLRHSTNSAFGKSHHSCLDPSLGFRPPVNYCQVCGFSLRKKLASQSSKLEEQEGGATETECLETGILGAGRVDPFATFPIVAQPYMHVLVDHCRFTHLRSWRKLKPSRSSQILPYTSSVREMGRFDKSSCHQILPTSHSKSSVLPCHSLHCCHTPQLLFQTKHLQDYCLSSSG